MPEKEIKQPGSEGQIQMASVFILEMRILRQKEHGSKQEHRLGLCLAHSITMSGMWRFDQRKEGETVSGSIFLDPVTRGYGLRLRTSREEDKAEDDYK